MRAVLHVLPSVGRGGTEVVAETLDALARARGAGSSIHPRLPWDLRAPWAAWLRWALATPRGDAVVHAHLSWPDRLGPALLAAGTRPLVVTFHLLPDGAWWPKDRLTRISSRAMISAAARRPRTRWVALSRRDAAKLRDLGVEPAIVRNAPPPPAPAADPLARVGGVVTLASVGRLDPQKGFDRMLAALGDPSLRALPWRWVIAGEGPARDALRARRDDLGLGDRVTLLGRRPTADLLAAADLLLAPSRNEGMPLVPLEAIEAGVPVLASPIEAHEELLGGAPGSLLEADEARWSRTVGRLVGDGAARDALALAQRGVLGVDPRGALWRAYAALYRAAAEDR